MEPRVSAFLQGLELQASLPHGEGRLDEASHALVRQAHALKEEARALRAKAEESRLNDLDKATDVGSLPRQPTKDEL